MQSVLNSKARWAGKLQGLTRRKKTEEMRLIVGVTMRERKNKGDSKVQGPEKPTWWWLEISRAAQGRSRKVERQTMEKGSRDDVTKK